MCVCVCVCLCVCVCVCVCVLKMDEKCNYICLHVALVLELAAMQVVEGGVMFLLHLVACLSFLVQECLQPQYLFYS